MPVHVIAQSKLAKVHALGYGTTDAPAPQMIFGKVDRGHRPNHYVVQCHGNRSCDLIATKNPCHSDRQQCLQWIQRCEAKENSDGRPESDGMRRVGNRHQGHVMRSKPLFELRQRPRQAWTVFLTNRWM